MPTDFPADLVQLRTDFEQAGRDLVELYDRLPPRACPEPEPYVDGRGQQQDAHGGWTDEDRAAVHEIRDRQRALAVQLSGHPWWSTLEGQARYDARNELQRSVADSLA